MSNFNYMDNIPVKIAEKYKPPPRIYQLPQNLLHRLQLPEGHYQDSLQYSYDFQLERKVLTKIPEWRRMRSLEREARQNRREKREEDRRRQVEEKQKQLLGAVDYPNAAELSSSDSEDNENTYKPKIEGKTAKVSLSKEINWQNCSFNSILQPTVLTLNGDVENNTEDDAFAAFEKILAKQNNQINYTPDSSSVGYGKKLSNTFNYKDFEEDTSSPFDNFELKAINDLDILAQVLHETQLSVDKEKVEIKSEAGEETIIKENLEDKSALNTIENPKKALEKVNYSDINVELTHIPNDIYNLPPSENFGLQYTNGEPNQIIQHFNPNQNILHSSDSSETVGNQSFQTFPYIVNSVNSFVLSVPSEQVNVKDSQQNIPMKQLQQLLNEEQQTAKSKSVPDILRELRDEIRNSEIRRQRLRNHSFNVSDEHEDATGTKPDYEADNLVSHSNLTHFGVSDTDAECLKKLGVPVQQLARNISSMGFPLNRVAKVAQIYGDNDKKIVEHLIPLTELLDLGFEETRISEALVKFDNNKEKALEHLIA